MKVNNNILNLYKSERTILLIIAYVTMLIDHAGYFLWPLYNHINNAYIYYTVFRLIGRFGFPLFCLFLVEGYFTTRSKLKYLIYLCIFAIISEIPFNLAMNKTIFDLTHQSVMLELLIGYILINMVDILCFKHTEVKWYDLCIWLILTAIYAYVAHLFKCDYREYGIIAISLIYLLKKLFVVPDCVIIIFAVMPLVFINKNEAIALFLFPIMLILSLLEQKDVIKSNKFMKILKYSFYPCHLLLLYLILYIFN